MDQAKLAKWRQTAEKWVSRFVVSVLCVVLGVFLLAFLFFFLVAILHCSTSAQVSFPSPSGAWMVENLVEECWIPDPSTNSVRVTIQEARKSFFSKPKANDIFRRDTSPGRGAPDGAEKVEVRWQDDTHLQIVTPPCLPVCVRQQDGKITPQPCEEECSLDPDNDGVAISLVPPQP